MFYYYGSTTYERGKLSADYMENILSQFSFRNKPTQIIKYVLQSGFG